MRKDCVVCDWLCSGDVKIVWQEEDHGVIIPDYSFSPFSLLVVPQEHYTRAAAMTEKKYADLWIAARRWGERLYAGIDSVDSIRYVQNDRFYRVSDSPFTLEHLHINIIPCHNGEITDLCLHNGRRLYTPDEIKKIKATLMGLVICEDTDAN